MERIVTLTELRQYLESGITLENVIKEVEGKHGIVKVFDHSPELMKGMRFRFFVMQLDVKNQSIAKAAKGANYG